MHAVEVQISRFADPMQPGWVECLLRDTFGKEWVLADKLPVFTDAPLNSESSYPQPGIVACKIIREWTDDQGRMRCIISTEHPWGVEAKDGTMQFEVFRDQIIIRRGLA